MKKFLIVLPILIMGILVACDNREDIADMDMHDKIWYAQILDFDLLRYADGQWVQGAEYSKVRSLINPDSSFFADFYTEVRFVRHPDEAVDVPNTVILAFPFENSVERAVKAINWEIDSANINLNRFGLVCPITVDNLVNDYENVNRLIRLDANFTLMLHSFVRDEDTSRTDNSRISFELDRLNEWNRDNNKKVLDILDRLNMSQDEGGPLLRSAGSLDRFISVTDLMITQGLTAEQALRRVI